MPIGLKLYPELCHGCGNCVIACPVNSANSPEIAGGKGPTDDVEVIMIVEDGEITMRNSGLCGICGTCVESCPVDAIRLEELE